MRRRHAHHAHERRAGNAHAGQVGRIRKTARHLPVDDVRLGEVIPQESEPGHDEREPARRGVDRLDLDRQQVARLRALDVDRSGERMDAAHLDREQFGRRHPRLDLPVEAVDGLHLDRGAGGDAHRRCNIRVPAVVALALL